MGWETSAASTPRCPCGGHCSALPVPKRTRQEARPCTHKSRLVSSGWSLSALPPKADIRQRIEHVCFVPIADIQTSTSEQHSNPYDARARGVLTAPGQQPHKSPPPPKRFQSKPRCRAAAVPSHSFPQARWWGAIAASANSDWPRQSPASRILTNVLLTASR